MPAELASVNSARYVGVGPDPRMRPRETGLGEQLDERGAIAPSLPERPRCCRPRPRGLRAVGRTPGLCAPGCHPPPRLGRPFAVVIGPAEQRNH
jgi:hypothetical protein